jgi:repressor of nif and glnA expression
MRLGKNERKALEFAQRVNKWHGYDIRSTTDCMAIRSLERKGLVETNEYNQFRITETGKTVKL